MSEIIVKGDAEAAPEGLVVMNFKSDHLKRFVNQRRSGPVTEVIIHETVTTSWLSTVNVLAQRNLGVHLIVGPDGAVYQHGDLQDDMLWHASQHNGASVGIETVNPYEPRFMPKGGPWQQIIDAPWAAGGRYVVPTPEQAEAVSRLTNWLSSEPSGLQIPQLWPGLRGTHTLAMGPFPADKTLHPGIHAHHYFGHADGAFLVLYCWLRIEACREPADAYADAIRLATGARPSGIALDSYFNENPYLQC